MLIHSNHHSQHSKKNNKSQKFGNKLVRRWEKFKGQKRERIGGGKEKRLRKKKRKGLQKKKVVDAPCKSNINAVIEEHTSSENIPTFCVDDHDESHV